MGGPGIVEAAKSELATLRWGLREVERDERAPLEYRNRRRDEIVRAADIAVENARAAFRSWAEETEKEARSELAREPIGSMAEETRKLRDEARLARIVSEARASGAPRTAAGDLAERAAAAFVDARSPEAYAEAVLLGRAAVELGASSAARTVADAQRQIDLDIPDRAAAIKKLRNVERGFTIFERDLNAAHADVLRGAAAAARATGDPAEADLAKASTGPSVTAKMAAAVIAAESGTKYSEPHGVNPGGVNPQWHDFRLPEPRR
jgi:hypothetical protein